MTIPADLETAREQAWRAYDAVARDMPGCEHIREWLRQVDAARKTHMLAIRACDKEAAATERDGGQA